jgi:hypothetical protein
MGFLTINGMLMTYDEYKSKVNCYKQVGLRQFANYYNIFKDIQIESAQLHWGEEIEYHLYSIDHETRSVKLSCDASDILEAMKDDEQKANGFKLMPEFGNWMIEAVPSKPYGTYADPE